MHPERVAPWRRPRYSLRPYGVLASAPLRSGPRDRAFAHALAPRPSEPTFLISCNVVIRGAGGHSAAPRSTRRSGALAARATPIRRSRDFVTPAYRSREPSGLSGRRVHPPGRCTRGEPNSRAAFERSGCLPRRTRSRRASRPIEAAANERPLALGRRPRPRAPGPRWESACPRVQQRILRLLHLGAAPRKPLCHGSRK